MWREKLRQRCLVSSYLFNAFFDRVVINPKVTGISMKQDESGRWEIKQVLYGDDVVLLIESRDLQHIIHECGRKYNIRSLKINVDKSKVLMVKKKKNKIRK